MLKKHSLCVKILLEKTNANVNTVDDEGRTLLGLQISNLNEGNVDLAYKLIIDHNADPNLLDANGNSPLMIAVLRIISLKSL